MAERLKKRAEISDEFKWKIEDIFKTDKDWQKEFDLLEKESNIFLKYKGKLKNEEILLECLKERDRISQRVGRVYVYAVMKLHEDGNESFYQGLSDKAETLLIKLTSAQSFIEPEIISMDFEVIEKYILNNKELVLYKHFFDDLFREKAHILSPELEELLAETSEIGRAADNIYSMINDTDIKFGDVTDDKGEVITLTQGRFISMLESKSQDVRKNTFETYYKSYLDLKNTLATTYSASVKKDVFFAKAKKYKSALSAALSVDNISEEVYTNLIDTTRKNLNLMHRYVKLRKDFLDVKELHMYDLYTPIITDADTEISYKKALPKVLNALKPLGDEYISIVNKAFTEGWVDVYENEGKRSGAYSWGAYGCHPFVLLNFDNKINDMFTIAHEIGHAMHSHYSWKNQAYIDSDYTIFVAEVASTVNEALLMHYLTENTTDPTEKKYLLNYYLEQFRGTLFRQVMFAEFEMKTHDMSENGEPLTVESLCSLYKKLNEDYYGDSIVIDKEIEIEWARIPHFYSAFYVYKYATGFSAAIALSKGILSGDKEKINAYLEFLKTGGSDYSISLLKNAGVDMTKPKVIEDAMEMFEKILSDMEKFKIS